MTIAVLEGADANGVGPSSSLPNVIDVGPCRCPTRAHGHDSVTLHPEITLPLGIAAMAVIRSSVGVSSLYSGLGEVYLTLGIASWTFTDAKGQPEPITNDNIVRLLPFNNGGLTVADAADELYTKDLLRPLAKERPELFPAGPPAPSTSASLLSGSKPRTPSGRSSRNGTAGRKSAR